MKNKKLNIKNDEGLVQLKNQLARALADYDNLRKRVEREREDLEKVAGLRFILRLLPILDALRAAQAHLQDSGLAITVSELENIFKDEGVEEIRAKAGENFNHNLHEAIEVVENTGEGNKIIEVVLSGWRFVNGPMIRHAKVRVSKKGAVK